MINRWTTTVLKVAGKALFVTAIAYVATFFIWFFMMASCVQSGSQCGGDMLTGAVKVLYSPFLGVQ